MTPDITQLGLLQGMEDVEGVLNKALDYNNREEYISPS